MTTPRTRPGRLLVLVRVIYPALLIGLCALVYRRAVSFDFVSIDDQLHVRDNPYVNPPAWAGLAHLWTSAYEGLYIPVSYTVYALLACFARRAAPGLEQGASPALSPLPFHLANILLHAANVLFTWVLLRRIVKSRAAAAAGAALFAVHPLQVESVAWVSEMRGVLSAFFLLAALVVYCGRKRYYVFATVLFALAVLAKPSAAIGPLLALLIDSLILRRPWRTYLRELGVWAAIGLIVLLFTRSLQPIAANAATPLWARPLVACDAFLFYLEKYVYPVRLCLDYGDSPDRLLASPEKALGLVACLLIAWLAVSLRRRAPWLPVALLISAAALLPVLGLVPFTYQEYSTVADRYAYVSLLGPAIILANLVRIGLRLPAWRPATAGLCGTILLSCAFAAFAQCNKWRDTGALIAQTQSVDPGSRLVQMIAAMDVGDSYYDAHRPADALRQYELLETQQPNLPTAHYNAGNALLQLGRVDDAIVEFQTAVRLNPTYALAFMNLGNALQEKGQMTQALAVYARARALDSSLYKLHYNIGSAYMKLGDYRRAVAEFDREAKDDSYAPAYVNEGIALMEMRQPAQAVDALKAAVAIGPPNASWYTNLAVAQGMSGNTAAALQSVQKALAIAPDDATARTVQQMLMRRSG